MLDQRKALYRQIETARDSRVIAYITGDRPNREAQIAKDAVDHFGNLLDDLHAPSKISLFLYTRGGDTLAAWSVVNLLREFCSELEVLIPSKCTSAGTLIALGADRIVMAKQAYLGPIDPSVNGPLNPQLPGGPPNARYPLSVEDVAGYMDLARDEGGLSVDGLATVFSKLAHEVHPLALGQVKRARGQIQALAKKLLTKHMSETETIERIVNILCTDAGSHDYAIYRAEARRELGLNIETPSQQLYEWMKSVLLDVRSEMELDVPFSPVTLATSAGAAPQNVSYTCPRVFVETADDGAYHYTTSGTISSLVDPNTQQVMIRDEVKSDGWRKVA